MRAQHAALLENSQTCPNVAAAGRRHRRIAKATIFQNVRQDIKSRGSGNELHQHAAFEGCWGEVERPGVLLNPIAQWGRCRDPSTTHIASADPTLNGPRRLHRLGQWIQPCLAIKHVTVKPPQNASRILNNLMAVGSRWRTPRSREKTDPDSRAGPARLHSSLGCPPNRPARGSSRARRDAAFR